MAKTVSALRHLSQKKPLGLILTPRIRWLAAVCTVHYIQAIGFHMLHFFVFNTWFHRYLILFSFGC